ncbi:uncharacterized protein DS421_13g411960 [Arachis hypogaea]|nr:uncharacterized protein DS421_13g411960 [Arachis hypogaea]
MRIQLLFSFLERLDQDFSLVFLTNSLWFFDRASIQTSIVVWITVELTCILPPIVWLTR